MSPWIFPDSLPIHLMRGGGGSRRDEIMTRTTAGDCWLERGSCFGNTRPARRDGIIDEQTELVPVVVGEATTARHWLLPRKKGQNRKKDKNRLAVLFGRSRNIWDAPDGRSSTRRNSILWDAPNLHETVNKLHRGERGGETANPIDLYLYQFWY